MPERDLIVIGGSSGALQALHEILHRLPAELPASIFVVIHTSPGNPGILPQILQRTCELEVTTPTDGDPIEHGRVYVAPPDRHVGFADGRIRVDAGPRVNGFRPAVDPLFATAAQEHGARVVAVVLSGGLDDGTLGAMRIKDKGGLVLVQDPELALVPSMPESAIENVAVDRVGSPHELGAWLRALAFDEGRNETVSKKKATRKRSARGKPAPPDQEQVEIEDQGPPSAFTCPDCGGALWESETGQVFGYRCHVGHTFTAAGLLNGQKLEVENALWSAVRALREHAALRRRMSLRAHDRGWGSMAGIYEREGSEAEGRAAKIRDLLLVGPTSDEPEDERVLGGPSVAPHVNGAGRKNGAGKNGAGRNGVGGKSGRAPRPRSKAAEGRTSKTTKARAKSGGRKTAARRSKRPR